MSEEKESLILGGKKFISSKRASEVSGYTADYIGQLARAGKVESQLIGRTRFVEERSLLGHKASVEESSSTWMVSPSSAVDAGELSSEEAVAESTEPTIVTSAPQAVGFRAPLALSILGLFLIFASFATGHSSPTSIAELWSETSSNVAGVFEDLSEDAVEVRKSSLASIILIDGNLSGNREGEFGKPALFPSHQKVSGEINIISRQADQYFRSREFLYEGYLEAGVILSVGVGEMVSRASDSLSSLVSGYFGLPNKLLSLYSEGIEKVGEKLFVLATSHYSNTSLLLGELREARDLSGKKLGAFSEDYVAGVFAIGDSYMNGVADAGDLVFNTFAYYLETVDALKEVHMASIETVASLPTFSETYVAAVFQVLDYFEKGINRLGDVGGYSFMAYLDRVEDLKDGYYGLINGAGNRALSLASDYVSWTGELLASYERGLSGLGEAGSGTVTAYLKATDKVTGGYYALINETGESFVYVLSSSGSLASGLRGSYDGGMAYVAEEIESDERHLGMGDVSLSRNAAAGAYLSFGEGLGSSVYMGAEAYLNGVEAVFENYLSGVEKAGEMVLAFSSGYVDVAQELGDVPVRTLTVAGEKLYEFSEAYVDAVFNTEKTFVRGLSSAGEAIASVYVPSLEYERAVASLGFIDRIWGWAVSTFQKIVEDSKSHFITNTARDNATTTTASPAQPSSPAPITPVAEIGGYVPPPPDYLWPVPPVVTRVVEREIVPFYTYTNESDLLLQKMIELQKQLSGLAVGGNFDSGDFVTRDMLGRYFDKYSDSGGDSPSINWNSVSITGGTISGVSSVGGTNATFFGTVTAGSFVGDGSGLTNVSGVGTSTLIADSDADTKIQVEESSDEDVIRFDTSGSERVAILANGMVGIGTTSPFAKLSVSGSAGENPFLVHSDNLNRTFLSIDEDGRVGIGTPDLVGTTGDLTISRNNSSSEGYIYFGSASASLQYTGGFSFTDALTIQKSNSPSLVVKETGNNYEGGFGVAGSAGLFSGFSTAGDSVLIASHGDLILSAKNGSGGIFFGTGAADTEKVRITSGGFLGVGTTSPYAKLSVSGDLALTGGLYDNNSTRGTAGQVLQSTGTGLNWVATSSLGITSSPGGSDTQIQFNDGGAFGGSSDFTWNDSSRILALGSTTGSAQITMPYSTSASPSMRWPNNSGFYASASGSKLGLVIGGSESWEFQICTGVTRCMNARSTGGPVLYDRASSATLPNIFPRNTDTSTGLGWAGNGDLRLISGGSSVLGALNDGTSNTVSIFGTAGQAANLQEWENSAGTTLAAVTSAGIVKTPQLRFTSSPGFLAVDGASAGFQVESTQTLWRSNFGTPSTILQLSSSGATIGGGHTASAVPLTIAGASSQSGNYFNITSSIGSAGGIFNVGSSGKVGIGTVSPHTKLWIQGATTNSISFNDSTATGIITLSGSDQANVRLQMGVGHSSVGPFGAWIQSSYDNGGDEGAKPFLLNPSGGNVGIGGLAPGSQLSVYGNVTIGASYGTTAAPTNGLLVEGNVGIGTAVFGTGAAKVLALGNATAPSTSIADGIQIYAEDVTASSELKVRDEAGNITTLSPHNFSLIEDGPSEPLAWSFYSERDGRKLNVDMLRAVRLIEGLSGERLVYGNLKAFEGEGALAKMDMKLADIEAKVTALQARQTESMSVFDGIANYLESFGVRLSASMAWFKNIVTDTLTVGSETNPTGITLYDEITGEPYCLKVSNGQMVNMPGKCDDLPKTPNILNPESLDKNPNPDTEEANTEDPTVDEELGSEEIVQVEEEVVTAPAEEEAVEEDIAVVEPVVDEVVEEGLLEQEPESETTAEPAIESEETKEPPQPQPEA